MVVLSEGPDWQVWNWMTKMSQENRCHIFSKCNAFVIYNDILLLWPNSILLFRWNRKNAWVAAGRRLSSDSAILITSSKSKSLKILDKQSWLIVANLRGTTSALCFYNSTLHSCSFLWFIPISTEFHRSNKISCGRKELKLFEINDHIIKWGVDVTNWQKLAISI